MYAHLHVSSCFGVGLHIGKPKNWPRAPLNFCHFFFWHDTLRTFNMEHNYNDNGYEPKSNSQQIQVPRIWAASKPEVPAVHIFWWLVTQCVEIGGYYQQTPTNKTVFSPSSTCSIQPRIKIFVSMNFQPWVQPKTPSIPYSDQLHSTKKIENVICHYIHQLLFIFTNDLSLYFGRTLPTSMVPWAFFNRRVAAFTFAPPEVSTFHARVAGGHSWYWWDTTVGHSWCN